MKYSTYQGIMTDGSVLEPGKIYLARYTGCPDAYGHFHDVPDTDFREYRAVKTGSLFTMRRVFGNFYHLPQYFQFLEQPIDGKTLEAKS